MGEPEPYPLAPAAELVPESDETDYSYQQEGVADDFALREFAAQLTRFYQTYNPSKVSEVPRLAQKYVTTQDAFWKTLRQKYPQSLDAKGRQDLYAEFEKDVRKFYNVHNPTKLHEVPIIAKKYVNNQDEFWRQVNVRYNLEEGKSNEGKDFIIPPSLPPPSLPPALPPGPSPAQQMSAPLLLHQPEYPTDLPLLRNPNQIQIVHQAELDACSCFEYGCFSCNVCCYSTLVKPRQYLWVMENQIQENHPYVPWICCCFAVDCVKVTYFDNMSINAEFARACCCTPWHFCCCFELCGGVAASAYSECCNCACCPCFRSYWPYLKNPDAFIHAVNTARARVPPRRQRMR